MPNGNNYNIEKFVSRTKIYLIIIALLIIAICVMNYKLIPMGVILFTLIILYNNWTYRKRKAEFSEQLQDLTLNVNTTAKTTLINSPFPLAIIETNGNIVWKSEKYVSEFANVDINNSLNELLKEIKIKIENSDNKEKGQIDLLANINNKNYKILGSYVRSHKYTNKNNHKNLKKDFNANKIINENKDINSKKDINVNKTTVKIDHGDNEDYTTILYFIDCTEKIKLEKSIVDNDYCLGIIMIDNYEEISQRLSTEAKPILIAQVEKKLYDWAEKYNSLIIKTDRDRFFCITTHEQLQNIVKDKVSILDEIKNIDIPELSQATLSVAFSNDGKNIIEKDKSTRAVIDIALGRGGDQAIIKIDGKYEFFGGRTVEIEKRTKVKARTVSNALKELIKESDNVILMGHINGDMDSIGSSLGLYRFAQTLGKDAKIINQTRGIGLENFIESAQKTDEYSKCFITEEQAMDFIKPNTLLIVVDTNKKSYVDAPSVLDKVNKVVVVDHHRRSTDYIENAILTFHEVYASSASELVTEILEYSPVKVELTPLEKETLYAGIMLDTKNFTFKTGVRTFEACAYLRKCGVNIIRVKKWFQSDLETYQTIAEIVSKSEIINDSIAISVYEENDKNANIIVAKAADELLTIGGITASFVLGRMDDKVYISGRSIGEINVQLILEKLGGGGHITLAGAQLENISLEDAKQELINRINEYFFETAN
jgi:c-di-AMP phosphodiesterase-like protein